MCSNWRKLAKARFAGLVGNRQGQGSTYEITSTDSSTNRDAGKCQLILQGGAQGGRLHLVR